MNENKLSVGGQALIEGVMMRSDNKVSIAVRKNDGDLVYKDQKLKSNKIISKIPIIRGMFALIGAMIIGIKALTFSAEFFAEADETYEKSKFDQWVYDKFGDKAEDILVVISMVMAVGLAILLFAVTPSFLINFLKGLTENQLILSFFEGITKILIFVIYLYSISRMKDIKRVFQYHGAEHKSIYAYENDEELTVENARKYSTLHPRCGTNFLAIVLMVSILIFSFLTWESVLVRVGLKILLLPLVAGVSYEVLKIAGKSENRIFKIISYPGMMMQKITTKEPDDKQIEVALAALKRVLEDEEDN